MNFMQVSHCSVVEVPNLIRYSVFYSTEGSSIRCEGIEDLVIKMGGYRDDH